MFRDLRRKNKEIPLSECVELLNNEKRGILSVLGDEGYPYGMPMNHYYNSADGCIYFHCGRGGHRSDALKKCSKASFCVCEQGIPDEGEWALKVRSVIVFGKMEVIEDMSAVIPITAALSRKFTQDEEYIKNEIKSFAKATVLLKLIPEHICGKLVKES